MSPETLRGPAADRQRPALYGAGALGASLLLQTIVLWLIYFYAPPAGQGVIRLSPGLIGLALAAGRIVNAVSNPLAAYLSDRVESRWGRRRPFIAIGAPALVAWYLLLWNPPNAPAAVTFVYVTVSLCGFFFFFSLVMNPYAALLPDITPGGHGRVSTASWQAGATLAGVGAAMIASPWLIARYGFGAMGGVLGVAALLLLWTVAAGVPDPPRARGRLPGFFGSMGAVLQNRAFIVYLVSISLLWLGTSMVNATAVYVITVLMGLPRDQVGAVLAAVFLCALAAFPVLSAVTARLGTPRTLAWTLGLTAAIVPLIGGIGLAGAPFSRVAQGYVIIVISAAPLAALLVLPNTLLADIAERNRHETQEAHEAMFYAVQGLVLNGSTAAASVILGEMLALGDSPGQALGLRLIPMIAGGCTLLALVAFRRFPTSVGTGRPDEPSRSAM
jgi:GPH family glycoside/pentoside/hexuronide:cation symporter